MSDTDPRIKEFTDWYHEKYQQIHGVSYKWGKGKEQKLMVSCLAYFDQNGGFDKMKTAAFGFLKKQGGHNLALFLTQPHKYLSEAGKDPKERPRAKKYHDLPPIKEVESWWSEGSTEEFLNKLAHQAKDPISFAKGFRVTNGTLRRWSPEKWKAAGSFLRELIGATRFDPIWRRPPEIGKKI